MRRIPTIIAAGIMLSASPAFAHPGHGGTSLAAGFLHPLTGADHLMAMVLVGLWGGLIAGRATWALPAAFLTAMLAGFGYGAAGHAGNGAMVAEMLILISLFALGGAVALKLRTPMALSAAAVGLFGFAHGLAHGIEAPSGVMPIGFAGGFLLATALLHGVGIGLAQFVPQRVARAIGVVGAGLGLVLAGAT